MHGSEKIGIVFSSADILFLTGENKVYTFKSQLIFFY